MPSFTPCAITLAAIVALVPAVAQAQQIRPGQWEVTMQGMSKPLTMCITPDMAKDPSTLMQKRGAESDCKSTNESKSGNTRTFNIACSKPNKYNAKVTFTTHGADHFTIFWRLVVPLSVPALAAFAIFQFLWVWNDLLVAYVFLGGTTQNRVLTIALQNLTGSRGEDWHLLTSAAFISMILPLIVFFSLQRYFIRGLTAGAVKG